MRRAESALVTAIALLAFGSCRATAPRQSDGPSPFSESQAHASRSNEQRVVDEILENEPGPAAVVVLGIESEPPRLLAIGRHLGADPVTQALRPGSTVKPLIAWVAAEAGVLGPGRTVNCRGTYDAEQRLKCFEAHGPLDLTQAITTSCNAYFFELGKELGLTRVATGLTSFGLARPTGLVPGEVSGFLATPTWAAGQTNPSPTWGLTMAAGHGPLEVTLLQLAVAYAKLAHRLSADRTVPEPIRAEIVDALRRVVNDENGTGHRAFVPGLDIAGKTGTAEGESFEEQRRGLPEKPENGWFVGFAPVSAPKTLVAAVVQGGGAGAKRAAPLAGRVLGRLEKAWP